MICSCSVTLILLVRRCEYAADYDTATPHLLDFSKMPSPARQVRCSCFCLRSLGICSLDRCALLLGAALQSRAVEGPVHWMQWMSTCCLA